MAEAHADIPWGHDQRKKIEIFVQAAKDLNDDMESLEKVTKEGMKTFGCLCCESGPLNLKVTLNKNGFVPGEYINVVAEVNNKSDKRIGGVYVMFDKWLEFKAAGHKEKTSELVSFFIRKPSDPLIKSEANKEDGVEDEESKPDDEAKKGRR